MRFCMLMAVRSGTSAPNHAVKAASGSPWGCPCPRSAPHGLRSVNHCKPPTLHPPHGENEFGLSKGEMGKTLGNVWQSSCRDAWQMLKHARVFVFEPSADFDQCCSGNGMQHSVILGTHFIFNMTKSWALSRGFSNERRVKRYCHHLNHISLSKWSEIWVGCYTVTVSFQAVDCWIWRHTMLQFNKVTRKLKTKQNPFSPQLGLALHGLMWQLSDISCARRGAHHQASEDGQKSWTKEGISWGEVVERFQLSARFLQRIMHSKPIGISWPKLC